MTLWVVAGAEHPWPPSQTRPQAVLASEEASAPWIRALQQQAKEPFGQDERERAIRELGLIGGAQAAQALLPLLDDPFVHLADRAVGAWVDMLAGPRALETREWMLTRGLKAREPAQRRGLIQALGQRKDADLAPVLAALAERERDPRVLVTLVQVLRSLDADPTLGPLLSSLLAHREPAVVLHAAPAFAHHDPEQALPALDALLRHKQPLARAGAIDGLRLLDALTQPRWAPVLADSACEPAIALADALATGGTNLAWPAPGTVILQGLLSHPHWRARAAAVQCALKLWVADAVPLLIARMPSERGRLRDDLRRALETLTGQGLGEDPELWTAWWMAQREEFDPGPRPVRDANGRVAFRPAGEHRKVQGTASVAFFELPLLSERVAFVFDLSGSMRNPAQTGDQGPTKVDLLRTETARTLAHLGGETTFDLFVYRYPSGYPPAPRLTRALGRFQVASSATLKKAVEWLDDQEAQGWGAFYEPLRALFDEEIDTIVLLSDGRPSRGLYDRDFRLLEELPRENRFTQVAIHTVLIGQRGADRRFMEDLAAATGGRFQEAKVAR